MADLVKWRLIGRPHMPLEGKDLWAKLGVKQRGLLAYLLVSGDKATREDAAGLLWPETDAARARHSLRQALVGLRNALGSRHAERLISEGDSLALNTTGLEVDLFQLTRLEALPEVTFSDLDALLQGNLFEGVDARSKLFSGALDGWRREFAERALSLIEKVAGGNNALLPAHDLARLDDLREFYRHPNAGKIVSEPTALAPASTNRMEDSPSSSVWRNLSIASAGLVVGIGLFIAAFAALPDVRAQLGQLVRGMRGDVPRIAVRPFTPISGDPAERQLAGGVTIGVTYALYSITDRELFVVTAPQSTSDTTGRSATEDFADDLSVRYLIHGTLERDGDAVRVFVSFYDAEIGADIWQDRFDSDFTEAFGLQDAITLRILSGLNIDLSTAERNRLQYLDDTNDLRAWLLAANGVRNLIRLDPKHLDEALDSYRQALEVDPEYVSARRGLAWHALLDVRFGTAENPEHSIRAARQQLDVILRKRPNDGMSRALEGLMLALENDVDGAIEAGKTASKLLPGSADVWAVLAHNYTYAGEPDLALEAIDRAMSLSPGHPDFYSWIKGRALRQKEEYDPAIEHISKGLGERAPTLVQLVELAAAYSASGKLDEARSTSKRVRMIDPDFSASEWVQHPAVKDPVAQSLEFELLSKAGL